MGLYRDQVVPRLLHVALGTPLVAPIRERVCGGLTGRVLEIGFGSGSNVPYYPPTVAEVAAVEPSDVGWGLARKRLAESPVPVRRAGLDGQQLPFEDETFDAVLSTWTLCTIPDPATALSEVRRVLRPGGGFHFVEHGLAPDEHVRRAQRLLEPVQKRLFGGCRLTRPVSTLVRDAGLEITELDVFYQAAAPKPVGADSLGVAVKA